MQWSGSCLPLPGLIIFLHEIQKTSRPLRHAARGRIHDVKSAQKGRLPQREQQQSVRLRIVLHGRARQDGNAHAERDAADERGRAYEAKPLSGAVLLTALLVISTATGVYAMSTEGPGSKHAPVILSLVAALIIGALAQKSRMCFAGSIRDVILMKNFDLPSIIAALFAVMAVYNLTAGNFHLGFSGQPIAHSQHLWNILGMYVVGFAAVLAGGCPLRQLILAGQGSSDSAVTFLGMLLGAAAAHNFGLAGAAAKAATETEAAVPGGPSAAGKIAVIVCIVVLFVIAGTNLRRKKAAR